MDKLLFLSKKLFISRKLFLKANKSPDREDNINSKGGYKLLKQ